MKYYHLTFSDAIELASTWKFLDPSNFFIIDSGVVTNSEPYHYATELYFEKVNPSIHWQSIAAPPKGYQHCLAYKIFTASNKQYDPDFCQDSFKEYNKPTDEDDMFHGTHVQFVNVILDKSEEKTDFVSCHESFASNNKAFYVTNDEVQAAFWGLRRNANSSGAYIITFEIDVKETKKNFRWKNFESYQEWTEFIILSRNGINDHTYDIVEGPFCHNPGVIAEKVGGKKGPYLVPWGHQIGFCNNTSIKRALKYVSSSWISRGEIEKCVVR